MPLTIDDSAIAIPPTVLADSLPAAATFRRLVTGSDLRVIGVGTAPNSLKCYDFDANAIVDVPKSEQVVATNIAAVVTAA